MKHLWALSSTLVLTTTLVISGVAAGAEAPAADRSDSDRALQLSRSTDDRVAETQAAAATTSRHGFYWQLTSAQDVHPGAILMSQAQAKAHAKASKSPRKTRSDDQIFKISSTGSNDVPERGPACLPPRREGDGHGRPGLQHLLDPAGRDRPRRDQPRPLRWRPARLRRGLPPRDPRSAARRCGTVRRHPRLRQRGARPRQGLGPRRRPDAVPAPDLALGRARRRRERHQEPRRHRRQRTRLRRLPLWRRWQPGGPGRAWPAQPSATTTPTTTSRWCCRCRPGSRPASSPCPRRRLRPTRRPRSARPRPRRRSPPVLATSPRSAPRSRSRQRRSRPRHRSPPRLRSPGPSRPPSPSRSRSPARPHRPL